MKVALGAYGYEGTLFLDNETLTIERHNGSSEVIRYVDILQVKAHSFVKKVTITMADRSRELLLWSGWPAKHKHVARLIQEKMGR